MAEWLKAASFVKKQINNACAFGCIIASRYNCLPANKYGEVAEWLKAHAWKACVLATVPRVRIPLSPPCPSHLAFCLPNIKRFVCLYPYNELGID